MKSEIKKLPQSMVEITVEVSVPELEPFMKKSAIKISENAKIQGFRPGKAPYETIKAKFGEMAILQEAIDDIIMDTYYRLIKENELVTIGQPKIDLEKIAPENPFVYKATVAVLPQVKVGALEKVSLKRETIKVSDEKVNQTLEEIRSLRAEEKKVERPAQNGDLVKFDFNVYRDGVPIENGASKNYPLIIGENRFIPGFEEQLVGLKTGDEKEFQLTFPKEYHEKSLAGKPAEFKVKVNEIAEIIKPELTDEFAQMISAQKFKTVAELKENIIKNLTDEETEKQERELEAKMLEELVKISEFDELPDILLKEELHRMMHELEDSIAKQGMQMADYLNAIKKTPEELETELKPQAELRVKTSILARELYQQQKMEVTPDEAEKEIEEMLKQYGNNPDAKKQLETETYKEYLKNVIGNRKIMDYLKQIIIK